LRSAGIVYVDRAQVLQEARDIAVALRRAHPEVLRVILYGSFAKGRGGPRSDLDVVLIVKHTPLPPRDRPAHYIPTSTRPIDLTVYTRAEVEALRAAPPPILRLALAEGIEL